MEIRGYRPVKKGNLDGFLDVYIPQLDWIIKGCGLFINGGQKWVNMPSRAYKDEEGKTRYDDIISMPKDLKDKFSSHVLKAYASYQPPPPQVEEPDMFAGAPIEF